MTDHTGDYRAFYLRSESWYAKHDSMKREGIVDEVAFGFYSPGGGTSGEMSITWHDLHTGDAPSPKLNVFNDAWHALGQMQDVLAHLYDQDEKGMSPKEFCAFLLSIGFKDDTKRFDDRYAPDPSKAPPEDPVVAGARALLENVEKHGNLSAGFRERVHCWLEARKP